MSNLVIIPVLTFALGFALARANTCTVTNIRTAIVDGNFGGLAGLVYAMAWAGLVGLALSLFAPSAFLLPSDITLDGSVVMGGAIMGIGAIVNNACFLGSVSRLGRGNINYLFTLIGLGTALFLFSDYLPEWLPKKEAIELHSIEESPMWFIGFLMFSVVVSISLWRLWRTKNNRIIALAFVGISGGLLFAFKPGWTYSTLFFTLWAWPDDILLWLGELGAIAVFAGAVLSAYLKDKLAFVKFDWIAATRSLLGGLLMGFGAKLVPGGNDSLLLWAIPGSAYYAMVGYAVMIVTIAVYVYFVERRRMKTSTE